MKLNMSNQDTEECVKKVRTRDMGYLWANMEKIDVQGTYEALTQARAELTDIKAKFADAKAELSDAKVKLSDVEAENANLKALLAAYGIEISEN